MQTNSFGIDLERLAFGILVFLIQGEGEEEELFNKISQRENSFA